MQKEKSLKEQYIEIQQKAFMREVNEEVRAEKLSIFWHKYKYYIAAVIVVVLVIVIAHNAYQDNKDKVSFEQAKQVETILSNTDTPNDVKISQLQEFAKNAKFGYLDIVNFNVYSMQIENGEVDNAIITLKGQIEDATDATFRDLAVIKLAQITIANKDLASDEVKNVISLLSEVSANKPLHFSAQYVLGTIYIKQNNLNLAKTTFDRIVENEKAPIGIKSQSLNMLNFIKSMNAK